MDDRDCVAFLQWALPRLRMRYRGFRRVRRRVCKRVDRRLRELRLRGIEDYELYLSEHRSEWSELDAMCRIPISRFCRDRVLFELLRTDVLPQLARLARPGGLLCWSAGCASGEEPYTLRILWQLCLAAEFPDVSLSVIATDSDGHAISRARQARFEPSSLRELPAAWRDLAFGRQDGQFVLAEAYRQGIGFRIEDLRRSLPDGPFELILCRNLVFTYYETSLQLEILQSVRDRLVPGGALVIGEKEQLPEGSKGLTPWGSARFVFRRA